MELMMEKRTDVEERSMKNLRITGTFPAKGKKKRGMRMLKKCPRKTEKTYLGISW